MIVVNDGSADGSRATLDKLALDRPWLRVVHHETNGGYGKALLSGFAAAQHDWIFYTDGDAQYDAREAALFVPLATDDIDVVQGYKIGRGDPWYRKVIGRVYHHVVKLLFRLKVRDTDCDFRMFRRQLIIDRPLLSTSGVICVEMMRSFDRAGARFVEIPVHHYFRPSGKSQFFRAAGDRPQRAPAAGPVVAHGDPWALRPASGAAPRGRHRMMVARWAFRAVLAASLIVFYLVGRNQWFIRDDWAFIFTREKVHQASGLDDMLFMAQDGHWMTIPILICRGIHAIFGIGSYWPYLLPTMACHLGVADWSASSASGSVSASGQRRSSPGRWSCSAAGGRTSSSPSSSSTTCRCWRSWCSCA